MTLALLKPSKVIEKIWYAFCAIILTIGYPLANLLFITVSVIPAVFLQETGKYYPEDHNHFSLLFFIGISIFSVGASILTYICIVDNFKEGYDSRKFSFARTFYIHTSLGCAGISTITTNMFTAHCLERSLSNNEMLYIWAGITLIHIIVIELAYKKGRTFPEN